MILKIYTTHPPKVKEELSRTQVETQLCRLNFRFTRASSVSFHSLKRLYIFPRAHNVENLWLSAGKTTQVFLPATATAAAVCAQVFLNLRIADITIYPTHVLVRIGSEVWIFFCISSHTKHCVHPTVQLVPVRSITSRVMISPVRLVVYVVSTVSRGPVSKLMVEEWQGVRPLPHSIDERFPTLLPSHIHVWVKEQVTRDGHDG